MPVRWDFQGELLTITVAGHYTLSEMKQAVAEALASWGQPAVPAILFDGRSSLAYLSPDEVRDRADWMVALPAERCALVVAPLPYRRRLIDIGLAHLGPAGAGLGIFTELEAAQRWVLGRDGAP
jgi:hypothetical protein